MSKTCTVCSHKQRSEIDKTLLAGTPLRKIAERFGMSSQTLIRHRDGGHIPQKLAKAVEAKEVADAGDLLAQVRSLQSEALGILDAAKATGDLRSALGAIREARGVVELLSKLTGELVERRNVTAHINTIQRKCLSTIDLRSVSDEDLAALLRGDDETYRRIAEQQGAERTPAQAREIIRQLFGDVGPQDAPPAIFLPPDEDAMEQEAKRRRAAR